MEGFETRQIDSNKTLFSCSNEEIIMSGRGDIKPEIIFNAEDDLTVLAPKHWFESYSDYAEYLFTSDTLKNFENMLTTNLKNRILEINDFLGHLNVGKQSGIEYIAETRDKNLLSSRCYFAICTVLCHCMVAVRIREMYKCFSVDNLDSNKILESSRDFLIRSGLFLSEGDRKHIQVFEPKVNFDEPIRHDQQAIEICSLSLNGPKQNFFNSLSASNFVDYFYKTINRM